MLNIAFELDEAAFDASADSYLKDGLSPALVAAVNDPLRPSREDSGASSRTRSTSQRRSRSTRGATWKRVPTTKAPPPWCSSAGVRRVTSATKFSVATSKGATRALCLGASSSRCATPCSTPTATPTGPRSTRTSRTHGPVGSRSGRPGTRSSCGTTQFLLGSKPETHYDAEVYFYGYVTREETPLMADAVGGAIEASQI